MTLNVNIHWGYILRQARRSGKRRMKAMEMNEINPELAERLRKEADEIQSDLEDFVGQENVTIKIP